MKNMPDGLRSGMEIGMEQLYAGSYNAPVLTGDGTVYQGNGKGITRYEFDEETGKLFEKESIPEAPNASWLAFSPDRKRLYAVNELDDHEGTKGGAVSAYLVQEDGCLRFMNRLPVMGAAPCHVDCAPEHGQARHVYTANYNGGSLSAFSLKEDGSLKALDCLVQHEPCFWENEGQASVLDPASVDKGKKKLPHVHSSSVFDGFLWITDLGLDTLEAYRLDITGGLETEGKGAPCMQLKLPNGCGPRSLAFWKNRIFVSCELSNEVAVLERKGDSLTLIQRISSLPEGTDVDNYVGGIQISEDGRYLYVGNRGHDSIAVFSVKKEGIVPEQWAPSGGRNPRGFSLSPSGKWLLAANQDSGNLTVMKRDEETGLLHSAGCYEAQAVVCLLF